MSEWVIASFRLEIAIASTELVMNIREVFKNPSHGILSEIFPLKTTFIA